jgi:hypothetical protein
MKINASSLKAYFLKSNDGNLKYFRISVKIHGKRETKIMVLEIIKRILGIPRCFIFIKKVTDRQKNETKA